ncbi:hypothetical protein Q2T49_33950, partial [Pseudomonas aeruginosa]|nr:hypothetical protein [Pseudomonas aeruginosa]
GDIERVLSRVALGSARPRDLVQLRHACAQIPFLRNALAPVVQAKKSKLLGQLDQELGDFKSLHQHLMAAIVENPPVLLRDGNVIAEGYDAALLDARLDAIEQLIQGYHESPVRLVLKEIGDIERVLSRVALGSARPRDLVQLRHACAQIPF